MSTEAVTVCATTAHHTCGAGEDLPPDSALVTWAGDGPLTPETYAAYLRWQDMADYLDETGETLASMRRHGCFACMAGIGP